MAETRGRGFAAFVVEGIVGDGITIVPLGEVALELQPGGVLERLSKVLPIGMPEQPAIAVEVHGREVG